MKLCLVGNFQVGHVGQSLLRAADELQIETVTADTREAFAVSKWVVRANWHFRQHRPPLLRRFSDRVSQLCQQFAPDVLLSTGGAPIDARTLKQIASAGIACVNYSTDDPWNPSHRSRWFLNALHNYEIIFSPRRSNFAQLLQLGGPRVEYLPFGYDPELNYPEELDSVERDRRACDVLFVGGGDSDRLPMIEHLIHEKFDLALYGAYWQRNARTRAFARGFGSPDEIRRVTRAAKVALCLVRRANRDGHVMRSFEIGAIGSCMLVEDTDTHRDIFGLEGEAVLYFRTPAEMTIKLHWLLEHPAERYALGEAVRKRVTDGQNSYKDRLSTMLKLVMCANGRAA